MILVSQISLYNFVFSDGNEIEEKEKSGLLHPVASLHMALRIRQARRRSLFSSVDMFKRALSARADLSIR